MTKTPLSLRGFPEGKPWQSQRDCFVALLLAMTERVKSLLRLAMTMRRIENQRSLKCYGIIQIIDHLHFFAIILLKEV